MNGVLEMALEALEYHREQTRAIPKSDVAIAALKEAIKQQELPELEAMEYWLKCNPPAAGAGYAVCWQAACKWQREAIKNQGENSAIDAIYAAWHGAGVDIAGGDWKRFVGMLPPLYTSTLTIPAGMVLVRDGNSLAMLQSPDGRIFRIQQLGTGDPWGNAADNDELVAMLSAVPKGDKP